MLNSIDPINYYCVLLPILQKGNPEEINNLLWQPYSKKVDYLPITLTLIQKLCTHDPNPDLLKIHKVIENGAFDLVIFSLPWVKDEFPFSPLIFDRKQRKIAGIMLPFNEILPHISEADRNAINELAFHWIMFAMANETGPV
jgi:hypothetical protein